MTTHLKVFAENIWIADGPPVNFYSFAYSVRMTIIKLDDGRLFVHSPINPIEDMMREVDELGEVAFLISPNKIHHLYLGDWHKLYPQAKLYASPGLKRKRSDLDFDFELTDVPDPAWAGQIDQIVFKGSRVMEEVLFFHRRSRTLILADLLENFDPTWFTGWQKWMALAIGIVAPGGKAPLDYRLSFFGGKTKARKSLATVKSWKPENIIIAHGACFKGNGEIELERAFDWIG